MKTGTTIQNERNENIVISTDKDRLDIEMICRFLRNESYWARERTNDAIRRSIDHSLCFGVYDNGRQVGFARAVTDRATVFYLADFFIVEPYRNRGIGDMLMRHILARKDLASFRGLLTTQTAHAFYSRYGFTRENDIVRRRIMVRPGQGSNDRSD